MADEAWHAARTTVAGIRFDRARGLGNTPNGEDVEHLGATVMMRPSAYLALAHDLRRPRPGTLEALGAAIAAGEALSPAFLCIAWPRRDGALPAVVGHEGRHRMRAVRAAVGNVPVPVHILLPGRKAAFLDEGKVARLRAGAFDEDRLLAVSGPLFGDARVAGRTLAGPAAPEHNAREPHRPFEPSASAESFLAEALRRQGATLTFADALAELSHLDDDSLDAYLGHEPGEGPEHHVLMGELTRIGLGQGKATPVAGLVEPAAGPGPRP